MKEIIKNRIADLRAKMLESNIDAFFVSGTDPHISEYLPEHWQTRAFISGFTGSAGSVVITRDKAALWTDSRYFLQANDQLADTGIELVKMRTPGFPTPEQWLGTNLSKGNIVGTDEWCIASEQFDLMKNSLALSGIILEESGDLLNTIWHERPPLPETPVFEHEMKYACTKREDKIATICTELEKAGATMQIITALDDLAWTFNLRGSDVQFNPVFVAYAIIKTNGNALLFAKPEKFTDDLKQKLENEGTQIIDYELLADHLKQLSTSEIVLIDSTRTNQAIVKNIPTHCKTVNGLSIPCRLKAIKSDGELKNIKQAMLKDGVAMTHFLYWIENNLGHEPISEYTVAQKLTYFRSIQPGYMGDSFHPIVGHKQHGAIVHFHVTANNALPVENNGFLLIDSGAQYLDGTTDITRTIALSELSDKQKCDFTLVLKGMIALSRAKFPTNTRGYHLDLLARKPLWDNGLNYGHGTGHGVGYFLNVHEGPMSIRQEFNERTIEAGMVLSNEPGLYRTNEYGIRTENMMVCLDDETTEFGSFLRFETLTLCPIDTRAIDENLLDNDEIIWINNYHQMIYDELSPMLDNNHKSFLLEKTRPI